MNNNVNPILLRPFLEIVLAIDSVLLKLRQFMSWLQSGHHAVYPHRPPEVVMMSVKQFRNVHQTLSL